MKTKMWKNSFFSANSLHIRLPNDKWKIYCRSITTKESSSFFLSFCSSVTIDKNSMEEIQWISSLYPMTWRIIFGKPKIFFIFCFLFLLRMAFFNSHIRCKTYQYSKWESAKERKQPKRKKTTTTPNKYTHFNIVTQHWNQFTMQISPWRWRRLYHRLGFWLIFPLIHWRPMLHYFLFIFVRGFGAVGLLFYFFFFLYPVWHQRCHSWNEEKNESVQRTSTESIYN